MQGNTSSEFQSCGIFYDLSTGTTIAIRLWQRRMFPSLATVTALANDADAQRQKQTTPYQEQLYSSTCKMISERILADLKDNYTCVPLGIPKEMDSAHKLKLLNELNMVYPMHLWLYRIIDGEPLHRVNNIELEVSNPDAGVLKLAFKERQSVERPGMYKNGHSIDCDCISCV